MGHYDVAVIGAGPAGIMAAIFAARNGAKTVLLEKNGRIGLKILATGNGRCNISNRNIERNRYHGQNLDILQPVFDSFTPRETLEFFEDLGLKFKEEDRGRLFPTSDKASDVATALSNELKRLNVTVLTDFTAKRIENSWEITGENGRKVSAQKLIITTGGKAAHKLGSSGDGLFWAKNLGHTIVPIHAALVPIETKEDWVKDIMGIKLKVKTLLFVDEKIVDSREGDLLFTHFGISGPAAMGLAGNVSRLLADDKQAHISIDLLPELSTENLDKKLIEQIEKNGKKEIKSILEELLPKKLSEKILALGGIKVNKKIAELSKSDRKQIVELIKCLSLTPNKVRPLRDAQVTAGGISTDEITKNLESKLIPGLFFAGEILDIDGDSGGFNLQWAWSSGKVAGASAAKEANEGIV